MRIGATPPAPFLVAARLVDHAVVQTATQVRQPSDRPVSAASPAQGSSALRPLNGNLLDIRV